MLKTSGAGSGRRGSAGSTGLAVWPGAKRLGGLAGTFETLARDGVEPKFVVDGSGPVAVILHGLAGNSGEFYRTIQSLSPGYRVVAPDWRGHGRCSRRPADTWNDDDPRPRKQQPMQSGIG